MMGQAGLSFCLTLPVGHLVCVGLVLTIDGDSKG